MPKEIRFPKNEENREYRPDDIKLGKYSKESNIEDFIYKNIDDFMDTVFHEVVTKVERQKFKPIGCFKISKEQSMVIRGPRVDLYVECKSKNNYIIEIKNPNNDRDISIRALGQILMYGTIFPEANKLVILSTKYDKWFAETVKKYNLPVDFVLFAKNQMFLLQK